ncbi:hypothetical protein [Shewanella sp. MBTL60-007]|uniref:hypothetical protein n=1 Tax=Shewanella sp. MBTL60-007 TaxID=2815911 RepID=UPI001BBFDDA6|nr:hypothetical protein [Shewanella sp. MBTL60-007]GIU22119.1 hypothetical protein TUM3792_23810 [Shewanella sp. MBTL60-007]
MNSLEQLRQYHALLKASVSIKPFINWFDSQIEIHQQAIERWPHERSTFERLISQCEQAKQKVMRDHQVANQLVALQLQHQEG